jgi:hypothetical protein
VSGVKDAAVEAEASVAAPAATVAPAAAVAPTLERVLDLQRSAGNRAVGQLLRLKKDPVDTGTVNQEVEEDLVGITEEGETRVHWRAKYSFEVTDSEVIGIVKLRMVKGGGVTEDQASKARQGARREFQRLFDNKFRVIEPGTFYDDKRVLRLGMDWVLDESSDYHATVNLVPGKPSKSEQTDKSTWHVEEPDIVHAHETGHLFGLLDEYVDADVKGRETDTAKNVKKDHSIMGAYPTEGVSEAAMKDRHALRIAKMIYQASNRSAVGLKVEAI